jgi:hypothetical protein
VGSTIGHALRALGLAPEDTTVGYALLVVIPALFVWNVYFSLTRKRDTPAP